MEEEMEIVFKKAFYGMGNAEINEFMEQFCPETNVELFPYDVIGKLIIGLHKDGYNVYVESKQGHDDLLAVKFNENEKYAKVFAVNDDELFCVLDWNNIYEVLNANKEAMRYVLDFTNTALTDDELNILNGCPMDKSQQTYNEARIALDEAIKSLRKCVDILHDIKF